MKSKTLTLLLLTILPPSINCRAQTARNGERAENLSKTESIRATGAMNAARAAHTAILLNGGKVLIAGGSGQAEVFNPANDSFEIVAGDFAGARLFATATLLQNGQVLIAGGYDKSNNVSLKAWIYKT